MNLNSLKVLLIGVTIFLGGCASTISNFDSIPVTQEEFNKPLSEIRKTYKDVAFFENKWRGTRSIGNIESLEEKWGKADKIEKRWGEKIVGAVIGAVIFPLPFFITIEAMFLYPVESYHWSKGDTQIEARIVRRAFRGYEKSLASWEWKKDAQDEKNKNQISLIIGNDD